MWLMPSSTAVRSTRIASSRSLGGPNTCGPASCMAPYPTRVSSKSPTGYRPPGSPWLVMNPFLPPAVCRGLFHSAPPPPTQPAPLSSWDRQSQAGHLGFRCLEFRGMNRERIKGHLDLLLLSVLSAGPAHGYAIITALRDRSDGTFDLPEGTIYPALHRLENAGLLSSSWAAADGRRRRVYALTDSDAAALTAERTEWRRFAGSVSAVVGWSM